MFRPRQISQLPHDRVPTDSQEPDLLLHVPADPREVARLFQPGRPVELFLVGELVLQFLEPGAVGDGGVAGVGEGGGGVVDGGEGGAGGVEEGEVSKVSF
jgi:hypothetical protein